MWAGQPSSASPCAMQTRAPPAMCLAPGSQTLRVQAKTNKEKEEGIGRTQPMQARRFWSAGEPLPTSADSTVAGKAND